MKKYFLALIGVLFVIVSCEKKEQEVPVTSVSITQATAEIIIGETIQLSASVQPSNATKKTVTWSSSNSEIATVDETGKVTAIKAGEATITAKAEEKTATCKVIVQKKFIAVSSVTLNKAELYLEKGHSETLVATLAPDEATDKTVSWRSSDTFIATVDANGKVTAISKGTAAITVTANDGSGVYASCNIAVYIIDTPDAVDLGLPSGLKWASFNLGASLPEEYGNYYAWGETEPKDEYSWETYMWCKGTRRTLTKYNPDSYYGAVDNKTVLEALNDVAHVKLGDRWRLPTDAEWMELQTYCRWTWTRLNGIIGGMVTGRNGNSIFLPATGYRAGANLINVDSAGFYWSSSLSTNRPYESYWIMFASDFNGRSDHERNDGVTIRPVTE